MKVLFAGDFSTQGRLKETEGVSIIDSKGERLTNIEEYAIVNYESPIASDGTPIRKDGPILENGKDSLQTLKAVGFNMVTLANNHLRDFGDEGVKATIAECDRIRMAYVGAGMDATAARKPQIITDGTTRVAILNVCENEFSIATPKRPGANPLDLINIYDDVKAVKPIVDYVVLVTHGGAEHYQLPTPRMKKTYRHFIDIGVDMVVNHHQHCFSGYERYNKGLIFYGLGNFLFDVHWKGVPETWHTGLMVRVDFGKELDFEIIPYSQCEDEPNIKVTDMAAIKERLNELNAVIADDKALNESFTAFVRKKKHPLSPMLPYHNHYLRALYHRGYMPDMLPLKNKVEILNWARCETYHEILTNYLEQELSDKNI